MFAKHGFRSVLAVNEFVTLAYDGAVLALRVTAAHTSDASAREVRLSHIETCAWAEAWPAVRG